MPKHKGLTYGMSAVKAKRVLRKMYKSTGKGTVTPTKQGITVDIRRAHQKIFDQVYIGLTNGVVTRMAWSYSNSFQAKMGGSGDAFASILTKLKEKVGGAGDVSKENNQYKFTWSEQGGLSLVVLGKDPNSIFMSFNCDALSRAKLTEIRESTNMGF